METCKKIVWLASYPKSGNTWVRAFITALLNNGEVDINDLKTDGIYSSRSIFDYYTDLDSRVLTDSEVKLLQPTVFNCLARDNKNKEHLFIKIHDAYIYNQMGRPIIPAESSLCAIYIIRNPIDIIPSLANHLGFSIEKAIHFFNNCKSSLAPEKSNFVFNQNQQLLLNWSQHVKSWINQKDIPVFIMRYEDLLVNTFETFKLACSFIKLKNTDQQIFNAIEASSFNNLKEQEKLKKFRESSSEFFREGKSNQAKKQLNESQLLSLNYSHLHIMRMFNYL